MHYPQINNFMKYIVLEAELHPIILLTDV